jgi:hypothetical protein
MAASPGVEYKGDVGNLRFAIFRKNETGRAFPMLVHTTGFQLDDLFFLETKDRSGYCRLQDFHRDSQGRVCYWVFEDSEIPVGLQAKMMTMTKRLLDREISRSPDSTETIFVSVQQNSRGQVNNG